MAIWRIMLVFFMALCTASLLAFSAEPIVINLDEADAPYMYVVHGKPAGVYPAIVTAAFGRMNIPLVLHALPWGRALAEADQGTAGVAGLFKTPEREQKYDYSEILFSESLVVFFSQARRPAPQFRTLGDLKGLRVGVHRGWNYGEEFAKGARSGLFTAEEVNTDIQNFKKLEQGRIDALIVTAVAGAVIAPAFKVVQAATPLSEGLTYLILPKSMNRKDVIKQFDQTIKDMKKSGEFQQIIQAVLK